MLFSFKHKLINYNSDNTDFFSLTGLEVYTKIIDAYDGDTCTVILPVCNKYYKFKCRLAGIDTPEIRTTDNTEKKIAIIAKNRLLDFKNIILHAKIKNQDKYGRYLIILFTNNGTCINDLLVDEGLAYQYHGGKKQDFNNWFNSDLIKIPKNNKQIYIPNKNKSLFFCCFKK